MDLLSTIKGSNMENYFPKGWDLKKLDECCSHGPDEVNERQSFWHQDFRPVMCDDATVFGVKMGHDIALAIKKARDEGKKLVCILPVCTMGMYDWAVYFLKEWNVDAKHVYGFNMDEWADAEGNTLDPKMKGSFQNAMEESFYGPLGDLSVPEMQRNFATKKDLPYYEEKIADLRAKGADMVTIYGIGRCFHIAFWEPQFAGEFSGEAEWMKQTYRLGAKLNPMTIEQNALHSFRSRTTQVPCFANTIGPALWMQSDLTIGGCDGTYTRGMMWQGMTFWATLRYGPNIWVPSSYMPTLPGNLFYIKELAGPLTPDCH